MGLFSKPKLYTGKVGGGFFFLSVLSLILLASLIFAFILHLFWFNPLVAQTSFVWHFAFVLLGFLIAVLIEGKISVFIHELKHSIVSNLAGNRAKGMKIEAESGHFEYAFSKSTSKLNAFISLAPYSFPLFTIVSLVFAFLLYQHSHDAATALLSCALGIDLIQNARDVSPHQTDFSEIRGGFLVGLFYVLSFNFVIFAAATMLVIYRVVVLKEFGFWIFDLVTGIVPQLQEYSPRFLEKS